MQRLLFILTVATTMIACGQGGTRQSTDDTYKSGANASNSSDPAFHSLIGWKKNVPFYVSSDAPDAVVEAAQSAAATWSDAVGQVVLTFAGVSVSTRGNDLYASLDDEATYVYYEPRWTATTSKSVTTLATTVWENANNSEQIVRGDVILNAQTYDFVDAMGNLPRNIDEDRVVDAETVILHEFGHLLGLDHIDEDADSNSIMHAKTFIGPNLSFRTLSDGDTNHIRKLYP
ncbi:MAG: matrixin family metalloprotease [Proteobacteria bacterium]|nr:MAG: matrixin family metalloprotease [Pseudomonadota bacterium]